LRLKRDIFSKRIAIPGFLKDVFFPYVNMVPEDFLTSLILMMEL